MVELLLPVPTIVLALGVFDVTCDTPTGLVVVQVNVTLQLPEPEEMVHEGEEGERLPDIAAAAHVLPFQVVPDAQLDVAVRLASSCWLLYR